MKHQFNVIINDFVSEDIQEAVDFYKKKNELLGRQFYNSAKRQMNSLKKDALLYQIRYDKIRCIKVSRFPYMIHYTVNRKTNTVYIYSVISTHKDPDENWIKNA